MTKIIPFNKSDPVCLFCKTPKSKVKKMVMGAKGQTICNVCILKCKELLTKDEK